MHQTSAVPQPFLLLIAANLALTGFLGWKWSLWSVQIFRKCFISLILSYKVRKKTALLRYTANQVGTGHKLHFCCWFLPIWPKLVFWAENGAYGLCQICSRYKGAKLFFSWPYMLVSMIWNTSEIFVSHLIRATFIFVVDCCQFGPG